MFPDADYVRMSKDTAQAIASLGFDPRAIIAVYSMGSRRLIVGQGWRIIV